MLVTAVNQNRELHPPRPPEIDKLIDRRAHGSSGVKHVVDQHDATTFDVARQLGAADDRLGADGRKIVTI